MSARRLDPAYAVAAAQVARGDVPFVVLAVAGADGLERLDAMAPPDSPRIGTGAVCLLASITKPIVATAVMRLAETGRFPITAPLSRWLPELDAAGLQPFTAWHVLTHTTGITDVRLPDLLLAGGGRPELLRQTIASGQRWAPGSRFEYSSFTFDLLAEAVARALGQGFEDVLQAEVLDPLGMTDTTFHHERAGDRRAPVSLGDWDGTVLAIPDGISAEDVVNAFSSLHLAGGGLWSTARDLVRFGRAMLRGGELDGVRVVGRPILERMTREVTVNGLGTVGDPLVDEHYAVGWGKPGPASPASAAAFMHGGVSGTRLVVDPDHDLVLVYLTGQWGGAVEAIDQVVMAAYGALE
jgi:CubicO group peptidase (beta-lactamase class C family)